MIKDHSKSVSGDADGGGGLDDGGGSVSEGVTCTVDEFLLAISMGLVTR